MRYYLIPIKTFKVIWVHGWMDEQTDDGAFNSPPSSQSEGRGQLLPRIDAYDCKHILSHASDIGDGTLSSEYL